MEKQMARITLASLGSVVAQQGKSLSEIGDMLKQLIEQPAAPVLVSTPTVAALVEGEVKIKPNYTGGRFYATARKVVDGKEISGWISWTDQYRREKRLPSKRSASGKPANYGPFLMDFANRADADGHGGLATSLRELHAR